MIGIHLLQIPPEGKHLEGEENAGFLDLAEIGAKAAGPVHYSLEVGLSGSGVFATGTVSVPVEMTCVACLQPFVYEAVADPFATQVEIEGRELVDLTPAVREELYWLCQTTRDVIIWMAIPVPTVARKPSAAERRKVRNLLGTSWIS